MNYVVDPPQNFLDPTMHYSFLQGIGTDENLLIGVLVSRTNSEIEQIKEKYKECKYSFFSRQFLSFSCQS